MTHQALRSPRIPWIYKVSCRLRCKDRSIIGLLRASPLAGIIRQNERKQKRAGVESCLKRRRGDKLAKGALGLSW
jgi:hypothetical protein